MRPIDFIYQQTYNSCIAIADNPELAKKHAVKAQSNYQKSIGGKPSKMIEDVVKEYKKAVKVKK